LPRASVAWLPAAAGVCALSGADAAAIGAMSDAAAGAVRRRDRLSAAGRAVQGPVYADDGGFRRLRWRLFFATIRAARSCGPVAGDLEDLLPRHAKMPTNDK
jgi:hypothetical protein